MFEKFEFKPKTSPFNNYNTQEGKSTIKKVFGRNLSEKMGKCHDEDDGHASDSNESCRGGKNPIVIEDSESDDEHLNSAIYDDENASSTRNAKQPSANKGKI